MQFGSLLTKLFAIYSYTHNYQQFLNHTIQNTSRTSIISQSCSPTIQCYYSSVLELPRSLSPLASARHSHTPSPSSMVGVFYPPSLPLYLPRNVSYDTERW